MKSKKMLVLLAVFGILLVVWKPYYQHNTAHLSDLSTSMQRAVHEIEEYYEILDDYQKNIVSADYTNTLLQRKIDHLVSDAVRLQGKYPNSKKIASYMDVQSEIVQELNAIRTQLEKEEVIQHGAQSVVLYKERLQEAINIW